MWSGISWSSSDPEIAMAYDSIIETKKVGMAILKAQWKDATATVTVKVLDWTPVTKLKPAEGFSTYIGEEIEYSPIIEPATATLDKEIIRILNPEIARLTPQRKIQGLKAGRTWISHTILGKTFTLPLVVKERISLASVPNEMVVGGRFVLDLGERADADSLVPKFNPPNHLLLSNTSPLTFAAVATGEVTFSLGNALAYGEESIRISYPKQLFPYLTQWGASEKEVKAFEEEHNGIASGELKRDAELELNRQDYSARTTATSPIPFRSYFFSDDGKLTMSQVYYPYVICFSDRGGGMGNFSEEFLTLLKAEGFSEPSSIPGASYFISFNSQKHLLLTISLATLPPDTMPYFVLSFRSDDI